MIFLHITTVFVSSMARKTNIMTHPYPPTNGFNKRKCFPKMRKHFLLFRFFPFGDLLFIGTVLIHAIKKIFSLLLQKSFTADGAFFLRRHIPNGKITFRLFRTAKENGSVFAEALDHRCAAFRA